jgi:hypothetical protein
VSAAIVVYVFAALTVAVVSESPRLGILWPLIIPFMVAIDVSIRWDNWQYEREKRAAARGRK